MIKTVKIFQEYELNIDDLSEKKLSNNINDDKIKENNSLYFIDIQIEKLILKFNLDIDLSLNDKSKNTPRFIIVLFELPKIIISSTDYRFNILFNFKNVGIARDSSMNKNYTIDTSDSNGIEKILDIQCQDTMKISDLSQLDHFLEIEKDVNLLIIKYSILLNTHKIEVKIPPIYFLFDHELLFFLLNFFNSLRKANLEKEDYLRQLMIKSDFIRANKIFNPIEKDFEPINNSSKQLEIKIKVKETNLEIIFKKELFLSVKITDINIGYNLKENELLVQTIINSVIDERFISNNNKNIIFDDPKLTIVYNDNLMKITITKPKITFLNRIIMDIVEYFYYILMIEVFGYNSQSEVKEKLDNITNINLKSIKKVKNKRKSIIGNLNTEDKSKFILIQ